MGNNYPMFKKYFCEREYLKSTENIGLEKIRKTVITQRDLQMSMAKMNH